MRHADLQAAWGYVMNGTQEIVAALKKRPCTYADMLLIDNVWPVARPVSTSPHRRVAEWLETAEGSKWELLKGKIWLGGKRYLVTWRLRRKK